MSLRIGGLASGMDIDSIVEKLISAQRMPLDRLIQKKQILEWQRDQYRTMNKQLSNFSSNIFEGIQMQKTFTQKTVNSSNESAVTVTNISSTTNINNQLEISQLAINASMYSNQAITADATFDPTAALDTQLSKLTNQAYSANTFTIAAIQADGTLGDEKTITFDPAIDSLDSILKKISSQTDVSAFYDSQTKTISLGAKNSGDVGGTTINDTANAEIVIGGVGADFLTNVLQLGSNTNTDAALNGNGRNGLNAQFTINGLQTFRSSNSFEIDGYKYQLKNTTAGTPVTISSVTDTASIFDSIKSFVDKYNETIDIINGKVSETKYRSYQPLTDTQKQDMSDKQIEVWEEKAKSGLLRYDSILSSSLNEMRKDLYSPVEGITTAFRQLTEIGIETSSSYQDRGKLFIKDEAKLKEAINNDPMAIYELFNTEVKDADGNLVEGESGIARRLRKSINDTISNIEAKAGNSLKTNYQFTIGRNLIDLDKKVDDFSDRLKVIENRYWRQFSAMEEAIQRANEQGAYLMQQFS